MVHSTENVVQGNDDIREVSLLFTVVLFTLYATIVTKCVPIKQISKMKYLSLIYSNREIYD